MKFGSPIAVCFMKIGRGNAVFSYRCKLIYIYVPTLKIYNILNIKNTLLKSVQAAAHLVEALGYKRVRFPLGPLEFFN